MDLKDVKEIHRAWKKLKKFGILEVKFVLGRLAKPTSKKWASGKGILGLLTSNFIVHPKMAEDLV